jgi:integrase
MQFMALTFVRTSELIGARWSEFDKKAKRWDIPAELMKMRTPHVVALSKQSLALLERLEEISFDRELLFPSDVNPSKSNAALARRDGEGKSSGDDVGTACRTGGLYRRHGGLPMFGDSFAD